MKLCKRSPEKNEHVRTLPGPGHVEFVRVSDEHWLYGQSRIEGSWLELNQASFVGASAFRKHQDSTDFLPLVERLDALENILNRGGSRIVVLATNVDRLCKIDELYK